MKRRFFVAALLVLAVLLTACGKVTEVESVIAAIGEVSMESKDSIEAAEVLFQGLSERQQAKVENASVLSDARAEYDRLCGAVEKAQSAIDAIGTVTLSSAERIEEAREAYDALEQDDLTKYVLHAYPTLLEAEDRYEYLCIEDLFNSAVAQFDRGDYIEAGDLAIALIEAYPDSDFVDPAYDLAADCGLEMAWDAYEEQDLETAVEHFETISNVYRSSSRSERYTELQDALAADLEAIRPQNGHIFTNKSVTGGYGQFTVQAGPDSDAYVKLENIDDPEKYVLFYVRAGEEAMITVLHGDYCVKYARGPHWFGPETMFGSTGSFTRAEDVLDFKVRYEGAYVYYSVITITLYAVEGGDMETVDIPASEF